MATKALSNPADFSTTGLPARVEEFTILQAQSTFTPAERKLFNEVASHIQTFEKGVCMWYWDLGQKMAAIYKPAKSGHEIYGTQFLLRLAIGLGYKTPLVLRNTIKVCEAFGTKKAFTDYVRLKGEGGNTLKWSHLVLLASVGNVDDRLQLAAATLERAWSAEALGKKIQEMTEKVPRGIRTAMPKIPASARNCLLHIQTQAQKFNFNVDNSWTGKAFDLVKAVKDTPADKLNEKLIAALQDTRKQVMAMQHNATELANILSVTEADAQARIEAQKAVNEKIAAAAAEDSDTPDEQDETVNLGEKRNEAARAKRQAAKAAKSRKAGKKGPARPGRVGT